MKKIVIVLMTLVANIGWTQTTDERMERDIRVAEDVLASLIRQQFEKNAWLPVEVEGSYRSGYGVTFAVPNYAHFPMNFMVAPKTPRVPRVQIYSGQGDGYSYRIETDEDGDMVREDFEGDEDDEDNEDLEDELRRSEDEAAREAEQVEREARRAARAWSSGGVTIAGSATAANDNLKDYNKSLIESAKTFLADYSSIVSQLKPDERVVITNRSNESGRYWKFMGDEKRFLLSIEATGADIKQYQTGKLTRDQFIAKIKVVESEVDSERSQDLELLTTIFDRLYSSDLSKTYFTEGETYYERLKDYGAIYYMSVFSSNQMDRGFFIMPTQSAQRVTEEERNKKVTELYPVFEKDLKENILEYGRTLKSLKPEEVLVFNIKLTRCKDCGIPSTLEVVVKASVLSDYLMGKLDKNAALAKIEIKKGPAQ